MNVKKDDMEYRPFSSIVEGLDLRLLLDFERVSKKESDPVTVAPRFFISEITQLLEVDFRIKIARSTHHDYAEGVSLRGRHTDGTILVISSNTLFTHVLKGSHTFSIL